MTDKVQKNQIADILLDFYDEYDSNVINRPMIPNIYAGKILDSLQEEPVSEDLEEASKNYALNNTPWDDCINEIQESFKAGAQLQKEQIMEALLSKVLPCFMHGGEADEVVAKLDEVLNQKKLSYELGGN